jgi:transposase
MVPTRLVPHLTYEELLQALKKERDARVAQNIQIILWGYEKNYYPKVKEITKLLHISKVTVHKWIQRWNENGLEGLQIKKANGRPPLLTIEEKNQVIKVICKHPRESGFEFSTWTLKMIAKYILDQFGKEISLPSVSQMLHQNKIVQLVPRTLPAKGDAKKKKNLKKD